MFPLSEPDLVKYYANIYAVAHADGTLSGGEAALLENLRKELKIKKTMAIAAEKSVEDGTFVLSPVGTWANQVDNLERMLCIALADGDLDEAETRLVATFANAIGLTQEQMDALVSGVKHAQQPIPAGPDVALELTPPAQGMALEFAESSVETFPGILAMAKQAPVFQSCIRGRKQWFMAAWSGEKAENAFPLVAALHEYPQRNVWIDGQQQKWTSVFGFVTCAKRRGTAYRPERHCFGLEDPNGKPNPWGCMKFHMDWAGFTGDADWLSFGQWEQQGRKILWRFDKARIYHRLCSVRENVALCPYLIQNLPEAVLQALPDTVPVINNPDWTYREVPPETPGAWHVTIRKREDGDYFYDEKTCILGVYPTTPNVMFDILARLGVKV